MNRIRELREQRGLSAEKLAALVGTTQAQISRLENGQRRLTVDWMNRIASALGIKPQDLIAPAPVANFANDAELISSSDPLLTAAMSGSQRKIYKVLTAALERKGLEVDDRIIVDQSPVAVAAVKDGDLVVALAYDIADLGTPKLVLRQYLAPGVLVPNSRSTEFSTLDTIKHSAEIVGIILIPQRHNGG